MRYNRHQVNAVTQQNIATMQDFLDALDRSPDLQREFHKHLVEVIRNDDDLRQEIRKEILTEELMRLPARFTRLEEDVAQIKQQVFQLSGRVANVEEGQTHILGRVGNLEEGQARILGRVGNLEEGQARMSGQIANLEEGQARILGRVANLEEGQVRMSGQIANLMGSDYENKAIEQSRRLVRRHLGSERATVVYASRQTSETFENEILLPAIRQGRIDRRQADQLEEADCIIRCEDEQGNVVCAVVEISVTVQDRDRSRAAERAEIFALATADHTLAFVVGQEQESPAPDIPDVPFLEYQP